nr:p-protein [Quercus suber]
MASGENSVLAFLGPEASYTHQHTLSPQTSISAVFTAVHTGLATHGVVPFENSSNGSVVFTLDLFASAATLHPSILVTGEIYLAVRHCLVGLSPSTSTSPNDPYSHITKLYSHPQAWGQCKNFLATHFPRAERQDVSSTSAGAALAAGDPSSAAIASSLAAASNNLAILASGIEDVRGNSTRFLILSSSPSTLLSSAKLSASPETATGVPLSGEVSQPSSWKTLLALTLDHAQPGALADSLAVFKKFSINLTSINSRPSGEKAWHYVFFVEFQGRRAADGKGPVDEALVELGQVTKTWRWLGSWANALVEGNEER